MSGRVYILSRNSSLYSTKRLMEEGRKLKLKVRVVDTLKLSLLTGGEDKIIYKGAEIKRPDLVIPRIGASITTFGGCVMYQMEKMNIPLLNSSHGMFNSRDKLRSIQILSAAKIATPRTLLLRRISKKEIKTKSVLDGKTLLKERVSKAVEMVGGAPCIFKLNRGTQGVGVILCNTMSEVYAQVDMLWKTQQDFIIQEFIKESKGMDVRALVIGNKVVASMKRESKTGDFRSNTHQGGEVSRYELSDDAQEMAVAACKALGLQVAGVDMLISGKDQYKIIEVNSSPGFEGLERATKINVGRAIMLQAKNSIKNNKAEIKKTIDTADKSKESEQPPF